MVKAGHNSSMVRYIRIYAASLFIIIGGSIYMLFRSKVLLGFRLMEALGLGKLVDYLRSGVSNVQPCEFIVYCLPDCLWTMAYILLIDHYFRNESLRKQLIWASIIPAVGFLSELLQLAGVMPGVFDIFDLLCYAIPYIVYWVCKLLNQN